MPEFIKENLGTIIVSAVLLAVIASIIIFKIRAGKKGKRSCGCGCNSCAMKDICHNDK